MGKPERIIELGEIVDRSQREAVREFVEWVATSRAYNGSNHSVHAQGLYNECINSVLPEWAEEWLTESGRA